MPRPSAIRSSTHSYEEFQKHVQIGQGLDLRSSEIPKKSHNLIEHAR